MAAGGAHRHAIRVRKVSIKYVCTYHTCIYSTKPPARARVARHCTGAPDGTHGHSGCLKKLQFFMISQNMLPFPVADALLYISLVLLVALSIKRLIQRPVDRPVTVRLPSQLSATT
jgi:hypothetical protein